MLVSGAQRVMPIGVVATLMMAVSPIAPANDMLTLFICGADGIVRDIKVPLDPSQPKRSDCAKACHGACNRKISGQDADDGDD